MLTISNTNCNSKKLSEKICEFETNEIKTNIKQKNPSNVKRSKESKLLNFEKNVNTIFKSEKFLLNGISDHDGIVNFLKDKDECLKKIELNDSIVYDNEKKLVESSIIENNRDVIDSFFSVESSDCAKEIYELL